MVTLLLLISSLGASPDAHLYGDIPSDVPTYSVYVNDAKQGVVALRVENDWYREDVVDLQPGQRATWYFETPWAPQEPRFAPRGNVTYQREIESLRKERLQKGWKEAGYIFRKGPNGTQRIYEPHLEYAQRSQAMAQAVEDRLNPPLPENTVAVTQTDTPKKPGIFTLYGPHIIILLIGLAALGAIIKFTLVDKNDGWESVE